MGQKIDKELAIAMRIEGKSYNEIAEYFGVSHQAVSKALKHLVPCRKKNAEVFENIPYKGLYEWMNAHKRVTIPKLAVIMGMDYSHSSQEKMSRFLQGRKVSMSKRHFDNLIAHTGMTYEQLFELREGFNEDGGGND